MCGISYQLIVYIATSVNVFKNRIDKYLVNSIRRDTHKIRESYTWDSMSRLSISK